MEIVSKRGGAQILLQYVVVQYSLFVLREDSCKAESQAINRVR